MGEVMCLAITLYFESRSESVAGNIAVSQVVLRRVESPKYPATICGVVWERKQFSFTNDGKSDVPKDKKAFARSRSIALYVLQNNGKIHDFSEGAINYYNPALASPLWARKAKSSVDIGLHRFLRF